MVNTYKKERKIEHGILILKKTCKDEEWPNLRSNFKNSASTSAQKEWNVKKCKIT